jgi:hypothetical protein
MTLYFKNKTINESKTQPPLTLDSRLYIIYHNHIEFCDSFQFQNVNKKINIFFKILNNVLFCFACVTNFAYNYLVIFGFLTFIIDFNFIIF